MFYNITETQPFILKINNKAQLNKQYHGMLLNFNQFQKQKKTHFHFMKKDV